MTAAIATGRGLRERFATANGIRIGYLDWDGTDPPVLLLHNNRGVADPWQRFIDVAEMPNRFIAPDQRDCGATDKPDTGYSVWSLAGDVAGLIDALGLTRVPIIGCAIGGSIGLAVAANYPEKVSALVMLDSGLPINQEIIDRSVSVLRAMPHRFSSKDRQSSSCARFPALLATHGPLFGRNTSSGPSRNYRMVTGRLGSTKKL
jgi:pimeloyl-ACP methyl ester carboxylesterase